MNRARPFRLVPRRPKHRHIAPRLLSGFGRLSVTYHFPPALREAIKAVAHDERKSFSWVVEQIVIDWAKHDPRLARMLSGDELAYKPSPAERAQAARDAELDAELGARARHARKRRAS